MNWMGGSEVICLFLVELTQRRCSYLSRGKISITSPTVIGNYGGEVVRSSISDNGKANGPCRCNYKIMFTFGFFSAPSLAKAHFWTQKMGRYDEKMGSRDSEREWLATKVK